MEKLHDLKNRLLEIGDLHGAAALLGWDQATYMPPGGAAARAQQMATLQRLAHEMLTAPVMGKLLDELRAYEENADPDDDDARLIQVTRRDYERAVQVPAEFMGQLYSHMAKGYEVWATARPMNDWAAVEPFLERTLDLSRRFAEFFPGYDHVADPLIDWSDPGMKAQEIRRLFEELRTQLVPLVEAISAHPPADDSCLRQYFPEAEQLRFGLDVIKRFGYDLDRGRQDKTLHPFMTKFSLGDVRITTRVNEHDLGDGLFSTMHESGHAMYEQGIRSDFDGLPLGSGVSSGVHESQSRLWENLVGRSRNFWQFWYPRLQAAFPQQLGSVEGEIFYRAINKVQRSLIRTDADEVTYNLHVLLRFDCELSLLDGSLAVRDLPEVWRERYQSDLGITPPDHRDGVLQDVHWYGGLVGGAFQGYTLGNILSAQLFERAVEQHPSISDEVASGEFSTLHTWLRQNVYQHGRKYTVSELIERATGSPLALDAYLRYLRGKYGELYEL